MHNIIVILIMAFGFTSCTKKTGADRPSVVDKVDVVLTNANQLNIGQKSIKSNRFQIENDFLDYLRFSGNVEVEIFKIVDVQFKNTPKIPSQLMILSQLLDLKFNKKSGSKSNPIFYNCNKIEVQNKADDEIEVLRTCEKKPQVIARLKRNSTQIYQVSFIQSEWQTVIGDSAMLNQKDKICQLVISNNKVFEINCDNTLITIGTGAQLEEIKLHHFKFDRAAKNQITITGGRFKDFVERSKINIVVPEEGKIKFKEEELAVRDDYIDPPPKPTPPAADFIPPAPPALLNPDGSLIEPTHELDMNNPQTDLNQTTPEPPADNNQVPKTGR